MKRNDIPPHEEVLTNDHFKSLVEMVENMGHPQHDLHHPGNVGFVGTTIKILDFSGFDYGKIK